VSRIRFGPHSRSRQFEKIAVAPVSIQSRCKKEFESQQRCARISNVLIVFEFQWLSCCHFDRARGNASGRFATGVVMMCASRGGALPLFDVRGILRARGIESANAQVMNAARDSEFV
jgi:hypothetical protein